MFRKIISFALCITTTFYAYGCTSTKAVSVVEFQKNPIKEIEKVKLTDGSFVEFDVANGKVGVINNDEIVGYERSGGPLRHIPTWDVAEIYYAESGAGRTVMAVAGAFLLFAVIVGAAEATSMKSAINNIGR